jgi:hypothetical protein
MQPKLKCKSAGTYFCDNLLSMFFGYGLEIKKDHIGRPQKIATLIIFEGGY